MKKNLILSSLVFVGVALLETLINQVLLAPTYGTLATLWREPAQLKEYAPVFLVIYLLFSISFGFLFTLAYSGKGILHGALIGLLLGGISRFWYGYTNLVVLPIPQKLAFLWFAYGTVEIILLGILSAWYLDRSKRSEK